MSRRRRGGRLGPEPVAGRQCRNDPVRGDVRCVSHGGRRPDLGPVELDALEEKLRREGGTGSWPSSPSGRSGPAGTR